MLHPPKLIRVKYQLLWVLFLFVYDSPFRSCIWMTTLDFVISLFPQKVKVVQNKKCTMTRDIIWIRSNVSTQIYKMLTIRKTVLDTFIFQSFASLHLTTISLTRSVRDLDDTKGYLLKESTVSRYLLRDPRWQVTKLGTLLSQCVDPSLF